MAMAKPEVGIGEGETLRENHYAKYTRTGVGV